MLGWLKASCPVDPAAKQWIEERLEWLCREFPSSAFNDKPIVVPTPEFFPDPYDGSKRAARRLLHRVCTFMGVEPSLIALRQFKGPHNLWLVNAAGQYLPTAAGLYEEGDDKCVIRVSTDQLGDPVSLVGTLAHELAHVRLLAEKRIPDDVFDNELLTDLTVVFHGLGVFLANVPRSWDSDYSQWPGTTLKKPEYMTPPMFGYALAHLAWHRREEHPPWANHLHLSARANLKQGLRYLNQTSDSAFAPSHVGPHT